MPVGEGWWLHPRREPRAVYEHLSAVQDDPRVYGMSAAAVEPRLRETAEDHRHRVLTSVLQNGWIRVRSHQGYTVFEYWRLTRRGADAIWDFIADVLGGGLAAEYQMNELATGRSFRVRAAQFHDDVEPYLEGVDDEDDGGERLYLIGRAMGQGR